ncbi:ribosome biogenesis protein bop1-B-like [Oenanthe melanoleuca]|uniref:ribosome biogenesis protein bop1-B-like n=1 Tax=Oenanthe melanoleuca TaxID=2939378 RepID=UPI0024C1DA94|nr:ribosome biogenesis protein bop1-B-like [Oenanthe melanoleuca]
MEQPSPPSDPEELSESEESVYSGLEDSGSDSDSSGNNEEEEEEEEEEESPGSPSQTQAEGVPGKRKTPEVDSPLEGKQDLLFQDEYAEDSSDEEVGIPRNSWNSILDFRGK